VTDLFRGFLSVLNVYISPNLKRFPLRVQPIRTSDIAVLFSQSPVPVFCTVQVVCYNTLLTSRTTAEL
jgi:hypothetical protein